MNNPNSELDPQNPMHRLAHQTAEELNQFHDENREIAIESMEEDQRAADEIAWQEQQEKEQSERDIAEHDYYANKPSPDSEGQKLLVDPADRHQEMRNENWAESNISDPYGW